MSLVKYLEMLAARGAPEAKLAASANKRMREEILHRFAAMEPKNPGPPAVMYGRNEGKAQDMLDEMMDAPGYREMSLVKSNHPGISDDLFDSTTNRVYDRIGPTQSKGRFTQWTKLGQPSEEGLMGWHDKLSELSDRKAFGDTWSKKDEKLKKLADERLNSMDEILEYLGRRK